MYEIHVKVCVTVKKKIYIYCTLQCNVENWKNIKDTTAFSLFLVSLRSWYSLLYNWPPEHGLFLNNSLLELIYFLINSVAFIIWATSWQNQQNGKCAQQRLRSAWASTQSGQSSLSAWRKLESLATHWVHCKDSDQTGSFCWVLSWGSSIHAKNECINRQKVALLYCAAQQKEIPPQVGGCVFQVPSLEQSKLLTPSNVYPTSQSMVALVYWPSVVKLTLPPVGMGNTSQVTGKERVQYIIIMQETPWWKDESEMEIR